MDCTLTAGELLFPVTRLLCQWASRERTWNIDSRLSKGGNTANFRHEPEMTVPRLPGQSPSPNRSPTR